MKRYIIKVTWEVTKNHELYEKYKGKPVRVEYNGKTRCVGCAEGELPYRELFVPHLIGDDGWESREDVSLLMKYSWLSKRQRGFHKTVEIIEIEGET